MSCGGLTNCGVDGLMAIGTRSGESWQLCDSDDFFGRNVGEKERELMTEGRREKLKLAADPLEVMVTSALSSDEGGRTTALTRQQRCYAASIYISSFLRLDFL